MSPIQAAAYLSSVAYLCTPRGERFRLSVSALMGQHLGRSTEGEAISLHMYNRPVLSWNPNPDRRPRLDLRGRWEPPGLVLSDGGSSSDFDAACAAGH